VIQGTATIPDQPQKVQNQLPGPGPPGLKAIPCSRPDGLEPSRLFRIAIPYPCLSDSYFSPHPPLGTLIDLLGRTARSIAGRNHLMA
jgi:hypothetical protein